MLLKIKWLSPREKEVSFIKGSYLEKQGKKNRSKRVYQVGKEENPATISNETFCWSKHPKVSSLYCQCVKYVTVLLQKSRFMTEKDRLDIDLQLFICFSHILSPTSPHKTPFLIHTDSVFRDCMTDAILACCFVLGVLLDVIIDLSSFRSTFSCSSTHSTYDSYSFLVLSPITSTSE